MQAFDDHLQQLIALGLAEAFLDALDAVQFDPDHHQRLRLLAQLAQPQLGQLQVGQPGEGVVISQVLQLPILLPQSRQVGHRRDEVAGGAGRVPHHPHLHPGGVDLPVGAAVPDLSCPTVAGEQLFPERRIERLGLVVGVHHAGVAAHQLLQLVAGDGGIGLVAGQDRSRAVGHHHAFLEQGKGLAKQVEPFEAGLPVAPHRAQALFFPLDRSTPSQVLLAQQAGQNAARQSEQQHHFPGGQPGAGYLQGHLHQQQPTLATGFKGPRHRMGQNLGPWTVAGVVKELGGIGTVAAVQLQVHLLLQSHQRVVEGRQQKIPQRQGGEGPG